MYKLQNAEGVVCNATIALIMNVMLHTASITFHSATPFLLLSLMTESTYLIVHTNKNCLPTLFMVDAELFPGDLFLIFVYYSLDLMDTFEDDILSGDSL